MSLPPCRAYRCEGVMELTRWDYPPDGPTTLHKRKCSICGNTKTYDVYEVGTMVEKDRLRSLDLHLKRFMKVLLEEA